MTQLNKEIKRLRESAVGFEKSFRETASALKSQEKSQKLMLAELEK